MTAFDADGFIQLALANEVLKFGSFELKSGRKSPYFFNAGHFQSGDALSRLGDFYAQKLIQSDPGFDVLFGPPYKGIPLVSAAAISLARGFNRSIPYAYARKETKDHGEGGLLVGAPLKGRVMIVDDVITAGTAIREAISLIEAAGAQVAGVIVAIDRQECGQDEQRSAIQEVQESFNVPVLSLVSFSDIIEYAQRNALDIDIGAMLDYRETYGVNPG
ncbi:MAG: orotate phosphoribosyltransferase [Pseudomonadales bacterium]